VTSDNFSLIISVGYFVVIRQTYGVCGPLGAVDIGKFCLIILMGYAM